MTERVAIDTNILIYSIDASAGLKHLRALEIVDRLSGSRAVLPLQVMNEFFSVCLRKSLIPTDVAEDYINSLATTMKIVDPIFDDLLRAIQFIVVMAFSSSTRYWSPPPFVLAARP